MKFGYKLLIFLAIFWIGTSGVLAAAGVNRKINFQGKVVNKGASDGTNVADANYDFRFTLWSTLSAGTSLWTEGWTSGTSQVTVTNGIFNVALGTYATFPPSVDFNSDSIFLSVNYNNDGDMSPRLQMAAVPYAFNAEKVGGLTVTNTNGVLTVASGVGISMNQSVDSGSTVTFAGINIGGTVAFTNIPIAVGTTALFIDSTGKLSKGVINAVGTTYATNNGLSMASNVIGLGGSLNANTNIGTSNFNLSFLGLGNTQSLFIGASGFVGIGTTNPATALDVLQTALTTTAEEIAHFAMSDDAVSYISVRNGSTSNGLFAPQLRFKGSSTNVAGNIQGMITTDTGVNPAWVFTSQMASSQISTRPLVAFRNFTTDVAIILANGNFGIGTTSPIYSLQIGDTGSLGVGGSVFFSNLPASNGSETGILMVNASGVISASGSNIYDNYGSWNLSANGGGSFSINSGNVVNFIDGVGISISQNLGDITISSTGGVGTTYSVANGLNMVSNVIRLGGTMTQETQIGTSSFGLTFFGLGNTQGLSEYSTGEVGIGTTASGAKLNLFSAGGNSVSFDTASANGVYNVYRNSGGAFAYEGSAKVSFAGALSTDFGIKAVNSLYFGSGNAGPYLTVKSGGLVGVGTTAPKYQLDVTGDALISARLGIGATNVNFALNVGTSAVNFGGNLTIGGSLTMNATPIAIGTTILFIDNNGNVTKGVMSAGSTYAFVNGLNDPGTHSVGLGGTMSGATQIGTSSFGLSFLGLGNSLAWSVGSSGFVGIGTSNPQVKLEVNSGTSGTAGLRFTQMTSATSSGSSNNKVLTVDVNGNVFITDDQTGSGSLPGGTNAGQTIRFSGSSWVTSNFLFNNESSVGIGTTNTTSLLDIQSVGSSNFFTARSGNNVKFQVLNSGAMSINAITSDIVKTSTGTGTSGDFEGLGATMSFVASNSDNLVVNDIGMTGGVQGVFKTSSLGTTKAQGVGGQVIVRDDGGYVIIGGGSSATASIWMGTGTTMRQVTVATGNTLPGAGAIALKRPDRKYLLIHANGSGYSSVFDPFMSSAVAVAGPPLFGGVTVPAGAGTNAFQRFDGRYVILGGGTTAWGLYEPGVGTTGTYVGGTGVAFSFGVGTHAIQRDDGNFIVMQGVGGSNYWLYSNSNYAPPAGTMTLNPGGLTAPQLTAGAFSIKMATGKFLVLDGGSSSSWIYDPNAAQYGTFTQNTVGKGFGPSEGLNDGAQSLWRDDGKYVILVGVGSSSTYILDTSVAVGATMFSVGPTLPALLGVGAASFMGGDGKYYIVRGGGSTAVDTYDAGYIGGGDGVGTTNTISYESEPINTSGHLNTSSTLQWNSNNEGTLLFFARTGVGLGVTSSTYKPILRSGDSLGVGSTAENYVQVKVIFKRDLPVFMDQEWGVRKSNQTRYRRVNREPVIYDYTIDNSASLHKTQFDFGNSTDESGPVQVNLVNDRNANLGLALALSANAGGLSASNSSISLGTFGTHNFITVGSSQSVVVMRRPNGSFTVAVGQTKAYSFTYDPVSQNFSGVGGTMTAKMGVGALAFKRPDGKYLLVLGDGGSATNIYDPILDTYSPGPSLMGNVGRGSQVIAMPNGRVLIIHGNYTQTSSVYDPFNNIVSPGVNFSSTVGNGALNIPRPDGTYLVVLGSTENCSTLPTTTNIFNPYTMTVGGTSPPATAVAGRSVGPGSLAFPRLDGNWIVVLGAGSSTGTGPSAVCTATNNTSLYNPFSNKFQAGPPLTGNAGYGAMAMPRANGTWLVVHGANLTTSSIYTEKVGTMTADIGVGGSFAVGPTALSVVGGVGTTLGGDKGGSVTFQRDDGKFVMISGAGATSVQIVDALWVDKGIYKSEQMLVPDLDSNSSLTWKATPNYQGVTAEVKTASTQEGLQTASAREIATPGGLINPANGDDWAVVTFNFKRYFPSYGGIATDVWYNGGSQQLLSNRTIINPALTEYSISKDTDLVNIKADGKSLFRVSSNGNVYTSTNGVVNSGGADLAENYSHTEDLQKGEVVAIDPTNNHAVKRSQYQYEPDLMGVVSSDPGFVAGSYTPDSLPIALIGRVPVLVSTENGLVRTGDRLTSSSTPGYAMRATKAGRVIGKALESMDLSQLTDCPMSKFGNKNQQCTKVMTFVNLTDYLGMPVETIMADMGADLGVGDSNSVYPEWMNDSNEKILQFLASSKNEINNQNLSEVFTDKVVSKTVVADTIIANKIKANSIEGMEIYTNKIENLDQKYESLKNMVAKGATDSATSPTVTPQKGPGEYIFSGVSQFSGSIIAKAMSEFWDKVLFKSNVSFEKAPTFNNEMAGFAIINKNEDRVLVKFDNQYPQVPIVNVTMMAEDEDGQNYSYFIKKSGVDGFTIVLNKKADVDIKFAWTALDVKDAKVFRQDIITITPEEPTPTTTPTFILMPTIVEVATPSGEASGSATISL